MPPSFTRGEIVLTKFPFTDLKGTSVRPALVVSDGLVADDLILAAISSVVRGGRVASDLTINSADSEFSLTGLRVTSVIRLHKLATVEYSVVMRRMGQLGPALQKKADDILRNVFRL